MDVDAIQVDLFGVECNTDVPDADGNVWSVSEVRGWDSPDQRTQFGAPTSLHGSFSFNRFANGRELVIIGHVTCASQTAAHDVYDFISASLPGLMGSGDVVVHQPVVKSLTVMQSGPPRVRDPLNRLVEFSLTVLAEYPWKRAVTPVTVAIAAGTTVSVAHAGTFPAEFTATTTSSGTVSLSAQGLTLSSASVASGTVFDSLEHTITSSGGADLYGSIGMGAEWPAVEVGSHDWVNAGTADVELTFYPTYA